MNYHVVLFVRKINIVNNSIYQQGPKGQTASCLHSFMDKTSVLRDNYWSNGACKHP